MKRVSQHWELWSYDVWGNEKDGYEVNDKSCFDQNYEVVVKLVTHNKNTNQEFTLPEITNYQIKKAFGVRCHIETEGDDNIIYVNRARDSYPIGEMRLIG